jgi:hypothetical protein
MGPQGQLQPLKGSAARGRTIIGSEMTPNGSGLWATFENNPVKAWLVQHAHDYPWSRASQRPTPRANRA